VLFRDTSTAPGIESSWKSLISNQLRLAGRAAQAVLSYVPKQRPQSNQSGSTMKKDRKEVASSEPLGIIISRGDKTEPIPVFAAYIWGPVPDAVQDSATRAA
jgi:hypothetical protein